MPFKSPERRREWMAEYQRKRRAAILKAQVVELLRAGVPPESIGRPETLRQRIKGLLLDREALKARIEWQSGGIKALRDQVATLEARLATLPAMEDTEAKVTAAQLQRRVTLLEAELTALQASLPMQRANAILDDHLREAEEGWR